MLTLHFGLFSRAVGYAYDTFTLPGLYAYANSWGIRGGIDAGEDRRFEEEFGCRDSRFSDEKL